MSLWFLRRLCQSLFIVFAMTVIVFIGVNMIGNPIDILVSPQADSIERARIIAQFGLDRPLWAQYWSFLTGLLTGNFGSSYVYGQSAILVVLSRFPATLELSVTALLIAMVVGIPLGLYCGLRSETMLSKSIMAGSILGFSLPGFWTGLLLIMLFSVHLGWLPATGRGATREFLGVAWSFLTVDGLRHMVLPAVTLALFEISMLIRLMRAGVQEVLPQEYVRFARAKGLKERRVVLVHVLKSIMIPIVTVIGLEFASLVAFSVVIETIFSWPGIGKLIIDSIYVLDRPVIISFLIVVVVLFVTINLVVDFLYTVLDPRVRLEDMN